MDRAAREIFLQDAGGSHRARRTSSEHHRADSPGRRSAGTVRTRNHNLVRVREVAD